MKYAKGWIAGLMAVLAVIEPLIKDNMQTYDWVVVGAAVLTAIGVVLTPNKKNDLVLSRHSRAEY